MRESLSVALSLSLKGLPRPGRALVVHDGSAQHYVATLESLACCVREALNPADVHERLSAEHFDLGLVGNVAPGMSALELVNVLHSSRKVELTLLVSSPATSRDTPPSPAPQLAALRLDRQAREVRGVSQAPLLQGELRLFEFLGLHAGEWQTSHEIAAGAFGRTDAAARPLVWKYASMLRKKLASSGALLETCKTRGYRLLACIELV